MKRICIAMPMSWDRVPTKVAMALGEIRRRDVLGCAEKILEDDLEDALISRCNPNLDECRNLLCEDALKMDADYLLFIDGDTVPPKEVVPRLLMHKKDIVSGLYFRKAHPYPPVSCNFLYEQLRKSNDAAKQYLDYIDIFEKDKFDDNGLPVMKTGLVRSDVIGMGCALITREALVKIGYPYFKYNVAMDTGYATISEDIHFCERAYEEKIEVWTDIDCRCDHLMSQVVNHLPWQSWNHKGNKSNV